MEIKINKALISVVENGPYRIEGDFQVILNEELQEPKSKISLCRCGESLKMPYCDGMHKKIGFKD